MKKGISAHRISEMSMKFVKKIKIIKSNFFGQSVTFAVKKKKTKKTQLIRLEEKKSYKRQISRLQGQIKRSQMTPQTRTPTLREGGGGETRNHTLPTLTFLFSALKEATESYITQHPSLLRTRNI